MTVEPKQGGVFVVGLTGGIAAGKSTVAAILVELGVPVIDADQLARELTGPGSETLRALGESFGGEILTAEGTLDRVALGRIVFADPAARRRLEMITHPAIQAESRRRIEELARAGHRVVAYEAALLCETGRDRELDRLLVVTADDQRRIERLMARSSLSRAEAEARLEAQMPQAEKAALADYLIDNSGSLEQTREQVEQVWRRVLAELDRERRRGESG
jgi:dephospho-CoA kinase